MIDTMISGVPVSYDSVLLSTEVEPIVNDEINNWRETGKQLARIVITAEGDDVVAIRGIEKSPVRRVRRITGYLSQMESFNDAKRDELDARYKHV